jgi:hypothetical protein
MFATPMKHVNGKSDIRKELVVLECPLERAVVVEKYVFWLWPSTKDVLHEILNEEHKRHHGQVSKQLTPTLLTPSAP